mmetsp:Transcript_16273/g.48768  ORF Transcript_16273/g.48768 Transcript_16273/m.48768 type:complete len:260 (-) Transcript_16273:3433-4212(-)
MKDHWVRSCPHIPEVPPPVSQPAAGVRGGVEHQPSGRPGDAGGGGPTRGRASQAARQQLLYQEAPQTVAYENGGARSHASSRQTLHHLQYGCSHWQGLALPARGGGGVLEGQQARPGQVPRQPRRGPAVPAAHSAPCRHLSRVRRRRLPRPTLRHLLPPLRVADDHLLGPSPSSCVPKGQPARRSGPLARCFSISTAVARGLLLLLLLVTLVVRLVTGRRRCCRRFWVASTAAASSFAGVSQGEPAQSGLPFGRRSVIF